MLTLSDLQHALSPDVLAGLADDDGDGTPDAAVVQSAVDAAVEEVRRATGEGEDLSPVARDIAVTLAVERLYERRREALPGPWSQRAERARRLLRDWTRGPIVRATRDADNRSATRETLGNL